MTRRTLSLLAALALSVSVAACSDEPGEETFPDSSDAPPTDVLPDEQEERGEGPDGTSEAQDPEATSAAPVAGDFDIQSHRFGRGENIEQSMAGLEHSQELDVTTLEFDIVLTTDGIPIVWHDPVIEEEKCSDTEAVSDGDEQFPYVGTLVHELTWEQIQTLNCDKNLADYPNQAENPGNKIIQLSDVFETVADDTEVHFNIETKLDPENSDDSAHPKEYVDAILEVVDEYDVADRVMIQSFDWRTLPMVHETHPDIPLVVLWDETRWFAGSQWTGDVDYDEVDGNIIEAALQLNAEVLSPGYAVPYGTSAGDDDYEPVATREFITEAHDAGLKVIPWTINDKETMREQIDAGVDGIITDYPSLLLEVLDE